MIVIYSKYNILTIKGYKYSKISNRIVKSTVISGEFVL